jgi:GTP pyrophosphokinase
MVFFFYPYSSCHLPITFSEGRHIMLYQDYGASTRDALEGTLGRLLDLLRMYAGQKDPSAFFMAWVKQAFASSPADRKMIGKTIAFANLAHGRKKRETGEPYIIHPISAAVIIGVYLDIKDAICIAGALGHDIKEDHAILAKLAIFFQINRSVHAIIDGCNRNGYEEIIDKRERDDAFLDGIFSGKSGEIRIVKSAEKIHNNVTPAPQKIADPQWRAHKVRTIRRWYEPMTQKTGLLIEEMTASRIAIQYGIRMI